MALRPETIARLQGILDGTIKVKPLEPRGPATLSQLRPETRQKMIDALEAPFEDVVAGDDQHVGSSRANSRLSMEGLEDEVNQTSPYPSPNNVPASGNIFTDHPNRGFKALSNVEQRQPDAQELRGADSIIETLSRTGHGDYSAFRVQIALDIYTTGHYQGNWDVSFDPRDHDTSSTLESFRVIQEDEYDQHMDDDEDAPAHDSMLGEVNNGYLFID